MEDESEYDEAGIAVAEGEDQAGVDDAEAVEAEDDQAGQETPEDTSDEALLSDTGALLKSYKEMQQKGTSDAAEIKRLLEHEAAVQALNSDPDFREWYDKTHGEGKGKDAAPKLDLDDDDLISVSQVRQLIKQGVLDGTSDSRAFIENMRTKEADRQRDDLLDEFPNAKEYANKMAVLNQENPSLTARQCYILASEGDRSAAKAKKTASRKTKAAKFGKPSGAKPSDPNTERSLDEKLSDVFDKHQG